MKCFNQQIHEFGGISIPGKSSRPVQSGFGGLYRALVERLRFNAIDSGLLPGELKEWFLKYTDTFNLENEKHQQSILMKKKHTFDVCGWTVKIGQKLGLGGRDMLIAETAALLHDTGRFEQCRSYGTFWDKHSFNHAEAGAGIIRDNNLLRRFTDDEQRIIITAVRNHNVFRIPDFIRGRDLFFLKLLRDADKMDILNIFSHYYHQPVEARCHIAGLCLLDGNGCSPGILDDLRNHRNANRDLVKTTVDHLLLKLSFLFDLNFDETLKILKDEGCIERIVKALPEDTIIRDIVLDVRAHFLRTKNMELFRDTPLRLDVLG
jgi:hypothetical protein